MKCCKTLLFIVLNALAVMPAMAATEVTGTTPGGAAYRIAVPDGWQAGGPLVLLQHGYHHELDTDPDLGPLLSIQLAAGYAVAASGYRQSGWALFTAIEDNAELIDVFTARFGAPGPLYAVGGSMGGLTALKFAEDPRFRDRTRGVLAFCAVDDGVASWDFAFDLRLIYDAVCDGSSGELADGQAPYPWAFDLDDIPDELGAFDLENVDLLRAMTDVVRCTGLGLPSFLRTAGERSRLAQLQLASGIEDEDFMTTNLAYATFGLGELLRAPDKLAGRNPFFNEVERNGALLRLSYDDAELNARIRRVRQEDTFARLDFERSSSPDGSATARLVSIHTTGDELTAPSRESATRTVSRIYRGAAHRFEYARESTPSHCGFTPAELLAGWDALIAPVLQHDTVETLCSSRVAQGVPGPCRFTIDPYGQTVNLRERRVISSPQDSPNYVFHLSSSGAWFDPQRDGEGIVIEELGPPIGSYDLQGRERRVLVTWYTYAPPGDPAPGPRWLIGIGYQTGQGVHVPSMTMTRGARFGAAFDPADVERVNWGSLSLTIDASRRMQVRYDGPPGWDGSIRRMTLLANVDLNIPLDPLNLIPPVSPPSIVSASGSYFNAQRDGEGVQFQLLPGTSPSSKRAFVIFYTYDNEGRQLWLTGAADNLSPLASEVTFALTRATGAVFGDTFDPSSVRRTPWGTLTLSIEAVPFSNGFGISRYRATALRWSAIDPAFGSGGYPLTRLTRVGSFDPAQF